MPVETIELSVHLSDLVHLAEPATIAMTITLPDAERLPAEPIVCFAKPGGSYSRGYFTASLPGPGCDAQARWHAERGWIFIAVDALGSGDSSRHAAEAVTLAAASETGFRAEQDALLRLANGTVRDGFPPVLSPVRIGLGHSMGACLAIVQQAQYGGADGLAILGFSTHYSRPSMPSAMDVVVPWVSRDVLHSQAGGILNRVEVEKRQEVGEDDIGWQAYLWTSYFDDVPDEVIDRDLARLERHHSVAADDGGALPPWASPSMAERISRAVLTPGFVAPEAAAVTVPVLAARGERDIVVDPAGEARSYLSAPSFDSFTCPRMGHMHNFSGTRALLWERIGLFGDWCAAFRNR